MLCTSRTANPGFEGSTNPAYNSKHSSSLLILDHKRKKYISCFSKGGHYDLLTAKASERETPHSLFRLLLLKVEIWWAIACVVSLFRGYGAKEDWETTRNGIFGFGRAKHGKSSKTPWKRLLLLAAKLLGGLRDVLSPGLRIHEHRNRGHEVTVASLKCLLADRQASVTLSCGALIICPTNRSSSQKVSFSLKKRSSSRFSRGSHWPFYSF